MKEGWKVKKLGEVCDIIGGGTPSKSNENFYKGSIPWATVRDMNQSFLDSTQFNISEEAVKKSSTNIISKGNVIIATRVGLGKVCILKQDTAINQDLKGVIPKSEKNLNVNYLFYWLQSIEKYLMESGTGMTVKGIRVDFVKKIPIPLPLLPEQQRIVSILDNCFTAIDKAKANAEQNLKNAKELFESYLQGVFDTKKSDESGWIKNRLEELGVITSSKRIYKSEYVEKGIPFYRTKEVKELAHNREISLELFISRERYEEIKNAFGVPQVGDLLISAVGTIGEILVIKDDQEFYFKDGNIIWLKDFDNIDTDYLKYALTAFVEKIKSLAIGSAYSALTIEKLKLYEISFPESLEKQQEIVQKLDALQGETQKLEIIYQKKLDDLEELKKSILQKAFAGELKTEKMVEEIA